MRKCKSHDKDMHPTKMSAIRAAISYSKKRGTPLRYYFHHDCKSWHLTHTKKKEPA